MEIAACRSCVAPHSPWRYACSPSLSRPTAQRPGQAHGRKCAELALAAKGSEAYAIVESLTTEIGPRMAGSPAFDRAIVWAQEKFKALGFDKVYLEPVTFPVWERRHESAQSSRPFRRSWWSPRWAAASAPARAAGCGSGRVRDAGCAEGGAGRLVDRQDRLHIQSMQRAKDGSGYGPAVVRAAALPMRQQGRGGADHPFDRHRLRPSSAYRHAAL